jgi:hypothetical protein
VAGPATKSQAAAVDDILEGFDIPGTVVQSPEPENPSSDHAQAEATPSFSGHVSGTIAFKTIYGYHAHSSISNGTDFHGITSLKSSLDLGIDFRYQERIRGYIRGYGFYDFIFSGRDNYTAQIRDAYENEVAFGEAYLGCQLSSRLNLKTGRQIVSFGNASLLPMGASFNPVDLRKPGLTEIEHFRLPTALTRLDYYFKNWRLTGLATHEFRSNKYPPFGSDFYPFSFTLPPRQKVQSGLDHQSYGLFAGGIINGWGIHLSLASFLAEQSLIGLTTDTAVRPVNRHHLLGLSMDRVRGSWLFKFDTAYSNNQHFYALPDQNLSQLDILFGTEYTGFRHTYISFEVLYRHLFGMDFPSAEIEDSPGENGIVWALSLSRHFFHNVFKFSFNSYNLGVDFSDGSLHRIALTYALTDNLSMDTGIIIYQRGDNHLMENIGSNDRIFFKIAYRF